MKTVIVFGSNGTLGSELVRYSLPDINFICIQHNEIDISNKIQLRNKLLGLISTTKIDCIVNCAAIIDTYSIETNFDTRVRAYKTNVLGAKYLADFCNEYSIRFIHISTNYVFSEFSQPILDEIPVNTYGEQKLLAELYIQNIMKTNYVIFRIGWVYGALRNRSFIHKFINNIKNHISTGDYIVAVVDDQISTPTSTKFISERIMTAINNGMAGVFSIAPSGHTSKYEFAKTILNNINKIYNIHCFDNITVKPIPTPDGNLHYPHISALDIVDIKRYAFAYQTWKEDLEQYMILYKDKFIEFIQDGQK